MTHQTRKQIQDASTKAEISAYCPDGGVAEYHVMIHATNPEQTFDEQLAAVLNTYYALLENDLKGASSVFKRYFLSDAANQKDALLVAVVSEVGSWGKAVSPRVVR